MKKKTYQGRERRQFVRLDYATPLDYKICKKKTIGKLLQGYTSNISEVGLFCHIKSRVKKNDIVWLSFDRGTLGICENLEKRSLVYQNGIVAKVVRVKHKGKNTCDVGVRFITREEKNLTHIYPKIHFLKEDLQKPQLLEEELQPQQQERPEQEIEPEPLEEENETEQNEEKESY